ncbi:MAG: hypothetical protein ACOCV4_01860 [Myxococcota bacterium]
MKRPSDRAAVAAPPRRDAPRRAGRREFLRTAASSLLSLPFVQILGCGEDGPNEPTPTPAWLNAAERGQAYPVDDATNAIADLGRRYLDQAAPHRDPMTVDALLDPVASRINDAPSDQAALEDLQAAVTDDFLALRMTRLEGWTLSDTELGLAALLYVVDASGA